MVVLANLREGVIRPDVYDPTLNPLYRDVLDHYGVVALPCRVRDPNRKGKMQSGVGHAQQTLLRGLRFETLASAQAYLNHWETRWADTRIHGTTKRHVSVMFAEERPHLQALPHEPLRYYRFGTRRVHLDGCVKVEAAHFALEAGEPAYRILRRPVERVKASASALAQIDPLIRHLTPYHDLIDHRSATA